MATNYIDIHQALIDRCRKSDRKAQYDLYQLYAKAMYNVCMRIVNHVGEAEDILQESFIEAFRSINDFKGESSFEGWLKKIVVNRSINYLKKRKLKLVEDIPETGIVMIEDTYSDNETLNWEVKKVLNAIQELPDGYRLVLSLYLLEGYDHGEIARVLNITESTSKSQYNRAKAKVREKLMK